MKGFRKDKKIKVLSLGLILLMLNSGLFVLLSFFIEEVNAEFIGDDASPPKNGDWIIDTPWNVVSNKTIILNGNLTVKNRGSLTLRNVTLKINVSYNGKYYIEVEPGGSLYISDFDNNPETLGDTTIITNNGYAKFGFVIYKNAKFEMKNSEIYYCGSTIDNVNYGLSIFANNTVIENCTVSECNSIDLRDSSNNKIINCIISNYSRVGIRIRNSSNNSIINCNISSDIKGSGISIWKSSDNIIANCNLLYNAEGIELKQSNNNIVTNCNVVFDQGGFGIILHEASDNNILNCIVYASIKHLIDLPEYDKYNRYGIDISWYALNNRIINCNVSNLYNGIEISSYSNNTIITNCNIRDNDNCGIYITDSFYNDINNCYISNNNVYGIWIAKSFKEKPSNNKIYHNNFISNINQSKNGGINNLWYNGDSEGNYWSDYIGLDNGANSRTAGDGIGDTNIPHLGLDNYPFMELLELDVYIPTIEPDNNNDSDVDKGENGGSIFSSSFGAIAFPVITIALVTILSYFFIATEIGKYSFFSAIGPLYTKKRKRGDISYIKGSIRGYILGNPGERYNDIKRILKLPNGTLTYYLNVLEKDGIIRSEKDGFNKRFYPSKGKITNDVIELTEIQQAIRWIIKNNPGISQKDIQTQLGISQQNLNYHIQLMVDARLIKVEHEAKITKCFVIDEVS